MAHVLIIDSDHRVAQAYAQVLQARRKDHVTIALGEAAGLAAIEQQRPDLVMLQFRAADFDGYGVLLKLREGSSVPAMFYTLPASDLPAVTDSASDMLYLPAELDIQELLTARDELVRRGLNQRLRSADYRHLSKPPSQAS